MIALAFFSGIFVAATIAILLVRGANAPQTPKAELLGVSSAYSDAPLYDVDRMRSLSVKPPVTDWDVAQTAEPETRVRYEFLNQTGMEES